MPIDEQMDAITVEIPEGIMCSTMFDEIKHQVINKKKLRGLLQQLAKHNVSESDDGKITLEGKKVSDVILKDALIDTCNSEFFEKHEDFYEILNKFDIVF
jgi:beta-galactosidase beta subunit